MANEIKAIAGTEYTLEASGASTGDSVYSAANDANFLASNVAGYVALVFEFSGALGTTGVTGSIIDVYMQPLNFEGTNDARPPSTNNQETWVGSIPYDSAATTNTFYYKSGILVNPHPFDDCTFYICNRTGQTLSSGWTLKVTPVTYQPA